jgi:hypothetical protein
MMERIPCKKCLLKDVTKDDYFQSIYEYIESIQGEVTPRIKNISAGLTCAVYVTT